MLRNRDLLEEAKQKTIATDQPQHRSELDMVRDAAFALRGIPSFTFRVVCDDGQGKPRMCVPAAQAAIHLFMEHPILRSPSATRNLLNTFSNLGTKVYRLRQFVNQEGGAASTIASEHAVAFGSAMYGPGGESRGNVRKSSVSSTEDRQVLHAFVLGVSNVLNVIFRQITELLNDDGGSSSNGEGGADQENVPKTLIHLYTASRAIQARLIRLSDLCCLDNDDGKNRTFPREASSLLTMLYNQVRAESMTSMEGEPHPSSNSTSNQNHKQLDITEHMTEYLFRESCAPWLANLANRLFDHTRAVSDNDITDPNAHNDNQFLVEMEMPVFIDDVLKHAIARASWSLRVIRESPQDNELALYRCCWSFFNKEDDIGRKTVAVGTLFDMVPRGATVHQLKQHQEQVQFTSSKRFASLLTLEDIEQQTILQNKHEMSAKKNQTLKNSNTSVVAMAPIKDQMVNHPYGIAVSTPIGRAQARRLKRINQQNIEDRIVKEKAEQEKDTNEAERRRRLLMALEVQMEDKRKERLVTEQQRRIEERNTLKGMFMTLSGLRMPGFEDTNTAGGVTAVGGDDEQKESDVALRTAAKQLLLNKYGPLIEESTRRKNMAAWKRQRSATLASSRASLKVQLANERTSLLLLSTGEKGGEGEKGLEELEEEKKQGKEGEGGEEEEEEEEKEKDVAGETKEKEGVIIESLLESIVDRAVTNAMLKKTEATTKAKNNTAENNTTTITTATTATVATAVAAVAAVTTAKATSSASSESNLNATVDDLLANLGAAAAEALAHTSSVRILQPPGGSSTNMSLALQSTNQKTTEKSLNSNKSITVLQPPGGRDTGMSSIMSGGGTDNAVVDIDDFNKSDEQEEQQDKLILSVPVRLFEENNEPEKEEETEEPPKQEQTKEQQAKQQKQETSSRPTTAPTRNSTVSLFSPRRPQTLMTSPIKPNHLWSHPTLPKTQNQPKTQDQPEQDQSEITASTTSSATNSPKDHHQNKLASLDAIVRACVVEPLRLQIQLIDSSMLLLFQSVSRINIIAMIEQLKRYMFMSSGYMFHEITSALWLGMLSAESADALGQIEKAQWTRSSVRLNGMLKKLSLQHESLLLSSSPSFTESGSPTGSVANPLSNLRFKYVVDRSNSKHAKAGNQRWDPYDGDSYMSIYPTFRLKFPEHIVVTKKNMQMYVGVHRVLFFADIVSHALRTSWLALKISQRTNQLRWLHVLRHRAHHVVRAMQEQADTSLHQAWSKFYQHVAVVGGDDAETGGVGDLGETRKEKLNNIIQFRTVHEEYVEEMAISCFVMDIELRQISFDILSTCLRCAQVMTLAARSNRKDRFVHLKNKAIDLSDDLSMLIKKFINLMTLHKHQTHFAALILSLNSLL